MNPTNQLEKSRDLTLKQRRWLEKYIETGNATEAAMQAYDCKDRDSANAIGGENLVKLSNTELFEQLGITKKSLAGMVGVGITKPVRKVLKKEVRHKYLDRDEIIMEYEDVPDYTTRHKYLETALKLSKMLENGGQNTTYNAEEMVFLWNTPTPNQPVTEVQTPEAKTQSDEVQTNQPEPVVDNSKTSEIS